MKHKSMIYDIVFALVLSLAAICLFAGCSNDVNPTKNLATVTLLNGEHYSVVGENKKVASDEVSFVVQLEKGYKVVGSNGDELTITDDLSYTQTVIFKDVYYKTVARLETAPLAEYEFLIIANGADYGNIYIDTVLGEAEDNVYYETDKINISVEANKGYRFLCWSTENFLADGGNFYSYESGLFDFDFTACSVLYANFKDMANAENTVFYRFENGMEIDQDCTAMLAHHVRANTLTADEVRSRGGGGFLTVNCWQAGKPKAANI